MKKMLKAEIEFIKFSAEDIITTSGPVSGGQFNFAPKTETIPIQGSPAELHSFGGFEYNQ